MSPHVQLYGAYWCVYLHGEPVFSSDYRQVEEWLDQAEIAAKCPETPAAMEPPITHVARLSPRGVVRNASVTSGKA